MTKMIPSTARQDLNEQSVYMYDYIYDICRRLGKWRVANASGRPASGPDGNPALRLAHWEILIT